MINQLDHFFEKIQPEIRYCGNCQPHEDGAMIWLMGVESDLEELFDDYDVPEKYRDELAEMVTCLNCGAGLDRHATIGVPDAATVEYETKIRKLKGKYEKRLNRFYEFISLYPYLGALHRLGIELAREIDKFPTKGIKGEDWWRARRVESGRPLKSSEMRAPDPKDIKIPEGRFNHFGQSHLYLSKSERGAAHEVVNGHETIVWIQKFRIEQADSILDLTNWWQDNDLPAMPLGVIHSGFLERPVEHESYWKPEYFVPRYIADAAKRKGLNGIQFRGSKYPEENLVLFHPDRTIYKPRGKPHIYELRIKRPSKAFPGVVAEPLWIP